MQFLFDRIETEVINRPHVLALRDDNRSLTWLELRNAIAHSASQLRSLGPRLGLLCDNTCTYVVAQLAAAFSGVTLVPLPGFFSDQQLSTLVHDAALDGILVEAHTEARAIRFNRPITRAVLHTEPAKPIEFRSGFEMVIYTSGSSGAPKGVCHGEMQLEAAVRGLAAASTGSSKDSYFSILPLPMLLETICAIFLPVFCGARIHLATAIARQVMHGKTDGILATIVNEKASAVTLVPQLLGALLFQMKAAKIQSPPSLRFVAVGGASVSTEILKLGEQLGVPIYQGYGLSECCSVVTLNRAGANRISTVGKPLEGVTVRIEEGEIVVAGPTVMNHYLGGKSASGVWRTGDLGSIDPEGFLTVHGRKDNLIVTSLGRNVSPEWVESTLMADPRIALAVVTGSGGPSLHALLIPSTYGQVWFTGASQRDIEVLVAALCKSLPAYAIPGRIKVLSMQQAAEAMLITANSRPIRCRIQDFVAKQQSATIH